MNPLFYGLWRHYASHCDPSQHHEHAWFGRNCGPSDGDDAQGFDSSGGFGAGGFGTRRPLRFLSHKLELNDEQVAAFAVIIDDLKTERAQAAVDYRRSVSAWADVIGASTFDDSRATAIGLERTKAAERVQAAVAKALSKMHALLTDDQRKKLAYLLRTGVLAI